MKTDYRARAALVVALGVLVLSGDALKADEPRGAATFERHQVRTLTLANGILSARFSPKSDPAILGLVPRPYAAGLNMGLGMFTYTYAVTGVRRGRAGEANAR